MARTNPLLSLPVVLGANVLQIVAFAYLLLWLPEISLKALGSFIIPFASPILTIFLILSGPSRGVALRWAVVAANLFLLLLGLVFVFFLSKSFAPGDFIPGAFFGVLVPVINLLAVVARWSGPRETNSKST